MYWVQCMHCLGFTMKNNVSCDFSMAINYSMGDLSLQEDAHHPDLGVGLSNNLS